MNITSIHKGKLEYFLIDNFYTKDELKDIYEEINVLKEHKTVNNITLASAKGANRSGVWVYDQYKNYNDSNIIKFNRKIYSDSVCDIIEKENIFNHNLRRSTSDHIIINFYSNDNFYDGHFDSTMFTLIVFLKIGNFKGGELVFVDFDEVINPIENTAVLFTGCIKHKVNKVIAKKNNYRVSISTFINYKR